MYLLYIIYAYMHHIQKQWVPTDHSKVVFFFSRDTVNLWVHHVWTPPMHLINHQRILADIQTPMHPYILSSIDFDMHTRIGTHARTCTQAPKTHLLTKHMHTKMRIDTYGLGRCRSQLRKRGFLLLPCLRLRDIAQCFALQLCIFDVSICVQQRDLFLTSWYLMASPCPQQFMPCVSWIRST